MVFSSFSRTKEIRSRLIMYIFDKKNMFTFSIRNVFIT